MPSHGDAQVYDFTAVPPQGTVVKGQIHRTRDCAAVLPWRGASELAALDGANLQPTPYPGACSVVCTLRRSVVCLGFVCLCLRSPVVTLLQSRRTWASTETDRQLQDYVSAGL